jgi:hypothetical protein
MRADSMKVVIALLMWGFAAGASASDWVYFATASDKTTTVDVDKALLVYGPITKVWVRYTSTVASGGKNAGDVMLERTEFNCATHEAKWVESITHPKFGESSIEKGNGSWEPVAPDSINEAILEAVCKPRAAKKS